MKNNLFDITPKRKPVLDSGFIPASLWNRAYRQALGNNLSREKIILALERVDNSVSTFETAIFPHVPPWLELNLKYVERFLKFLLWTQSGCKITIAGNGALTNELRVIYSSSGKRKFDHQVMGRKIYGTEMIIENCDINDAPLPREKIVPIAKSFKGCRIGFDLGGSDRKCAAVIDGKVIFSEEIPWSPYFQKDPQWHKREINDSLKRAVAKLPRVDAIGGSAAGIYVDNKVCFASLFRSVDNDGFNKYVRNMFVELQHEWNDVPFVVVNDGMVSALAGAMMINDNAVMGIAMGTSQAAGYITPEGNFNNWLNDLSFSPVDYRADAPIDEWSGDRGCGVQYFSQQAIARLAPCSGIFLQESMLLPEKLVKIQELMEKDDTRAENIFRTIGTYLGYALAHYNELYEIRNLMLMGRVVSGKGGNVILSEAREVLKAEFPELASSIKFHIPDEKSKRHGQAIVAASLPVVCENQRETWRRKL